MHPSPAVPFVTPMPYPKGVQPKVTGEPYFRFKVSPPLFSRLRSKILCLPPTGVRIEGVRRKPTLWQSKGIKDSYPKG